MKKIFLILIFLLSCVSMSFANSTLRFDPFDGSWRPSGTWGITQYFIHSGASTINSSGTPEVRNVDVTANIGVTTIATWQNILKVPFYFSMSLSYGGVSINEGFEGGLAKAAGFGDTTFGVSGRVLGWENGYMNLTLNVVAPTGIYDYKSNANMGENRWVITPILDISHMIGRFNIDFHAGYDFFTDNTKYTVDELTLKKDGEIFAEMHFAYILSEQIGAYASVGFGGVWGSKEKINGTTVSENRNDYGVKIALGTPITDNIDILVHYLQDVYVENGPLNYQIEAFVNIVF